MMVYKVTESEKTGDGPGDYRFRLECRGRRMLLVLGINPNAVDERYPDPTTYRIMGFASNAGYDGFMLLNLSSELTVRKGGLAEELNLQMHVRNLETMRGVARQYPDAESLVALGNDITSRPYLIPCLRDIYNVLGFRRKWLKIGRLTVEGHPRHPLYARYEDGLTPFDIGAYLLEWT